jgi:hypothetical protein
MKSTYSILAILFTVGAAAYAQVEPAATGPRNPLPSGNLSYSAHYSQTAEFGSYLGNYQTANLSANVNYTNGKERHPFSLGYGGGYTWGISGPAYAQGFFQNLLVSQGFAWRKWDVMASDNISYRPQAPTTGFSGVAGTGEPIGNPSPPSSQSILTVNTHVVNNTTTGEVDHQLDFARSLNSGGSYDLLRYPDGNGINTDSAMAHAGLSQRLNARNTLTATYMFSVFQYPDYDFSLMTNTGLFGIKRVWTRKITTTASAGPQWTESLDSTTPPSMLGVSINANATYSYHFQTASVTYSRGVNSGGGYLIGAESDSVSGAFSQDFGKNFTLGVSGSYRQSSGLQDGIPGQAANENITSEYGGVQATRRLGRYLTFFAGYTATQQSTTTALPGNVLNGLQQMVNFGIGYSPREMHLRH